MMSDKNEEFKLDYEGMHKSLFKEKMVYKEQLHSVILSSVTLEWSINQLVETVAKKIHSTNLEGWAKNPNIPISRKLRALRFANIINESLYKNLIILFKIRNKFAHKIPLPHKILEKEFILLDDVDIDNEFVKNLTNDSIKYQLIISQCFVELLLISKKLDPSSVLDLELVGDIIPLEE